MHIYCDESGGIGRGVMTLAAVAIEPDAAASLLTQAKDHLRVTGELKGSRINLAQRRKFFDIFGQSDATAMVGIAISALRRAPTEDRGDHDRNVYTALLEDVIGALLPNAGTCPNIVFDDGRYGPDALSHIRTKLGEDVGPFGTVTLELSHMSAGLQIADVIANSFFNRALVSERQSEMAATVAPFLESGKIRMRILDRVEEG